MRLDATIRACVLTCGALSAAAAAAGAGAAYTCEQDPPLQELKR